jgi:DNA-binding GntR family transcriptional regulator
MKEISIDNTPLSEKIAERIRGFILKGTLKQGERLTEPSLSKLLGISRTPIREALRLLEIEGFVELIPRKGAVVKTITDKDVDEIFELKIRLESLAAKNSAKNMTDFDIDKLKNINEKIRNLIGTNNVSQLIKLNSEFHEQFMSKCENLRLLKFLESLSLQFKMATAYSFSVTGRIKQVVEEHEMLIDAFEEKNEDKVEKLVEMHNSNGWKFIKDRVVKVI